jgi:hypothetical protein
MNLLEREVRPQSRFEKQLSRILDARIPRILSLKDWLCR